MTEQDDRYWILHPRGHRAYASEFRPSVGDMVEFMGEMVPVIASTIPVDGTWICDLCNTDILIDWGDEPFPVPLIGSNALCLKCFTEVQEWPKMDEWGDDIRGTRLGDWPAHLCTCLPCTFQMLTWKGQLEVAYGVSA